MHHLANDANETIMALKNIFRPAGIHDSNLEQLAVGDTILKKSNLIFYEQSRVIRYFL
jgi:hypothetical protein